MSVDSIWRRPTATAVPGGGVPDLVIAGVSVSPGTPTANADFSINVTVNNQGNGAANNVLVRLVLNAPGGMSISLPNSEAGIPTIPPGASVTVNYIGVRASTTGNVTANVTVDPNNSIPETNDGNNGQGFAFDVAAPAPDLVITEIDVDEDEGSTQVGLRIVARNQGTDDTGDFQIAVDFNPPNVVQQILFCEDLDPGEQCEQFLDVDLGAFGDYSATANADWNNTQAESREDNNVRTVEFELDDD